MLSTLFFYGGMGMLALRITLGGIILAHGWPKIKDLKKTMANFGAMGFKPGALWGSVAAFLEFFGSIALILGIGTQYAAALFVGEFIVILIWRIKNKHTFVGGWELDFLILGAMLVILFNGAGTYSLDRILRLGYFGW